MDLKNPNLPQNWSKTLNSKFLQKPTLQKSEALIFDFAETYHLTKVFVTELKNRFGFFKFSATKVAKGLQKSKSFKFWRLRIHWSLWTNLKTNDKSALSNVFWYVKVCIFWKCIQYTIHWDNTQILKKFPSDKINTMVQKMPSFFFYKFQLITVLLLICDSYMSWSTRLVSLKLCVRFSIFNSVLFLLKFIFLFNKMHRLFEATHSFALRSLIFKLQQEVLKFSDICVSLPKSWPGDKFFKPRKTKFWECQFLSIIQPSNFNIFCCGK